LQFFAIFCLSSVTVDSFSSFYSNRLDDDAAITIRFSKFIRKIITAILKLNLYRFIFLLVSLASFEYVLENSIIKLSSDLAFSYVNLVCFILHFASKLFPFYNWWTVVIVIGSPMHSQLIYMSRAYYMGHRLAKMKWSEPRTCRRYQCALLYFFWPDVNSLNKIFQSGLLLKMSYHDRSAKDHMIRIQARLSMKYLRVTVREYCICEPRFSSSEGWSF